MRVLVTGASGFIGLNLVEALLAQGDRVIGLDRLAPPKTFPPFPFVQADVRESASLQSIFRQHRPDALVHAAALTPGRASERSRMAAAVEVNVLGTVHAMEAAAAAGCARILFLSSAAVYGQARGEHVLDEERTPAVPGTLYGITKLAAERLALRYSELDVTAMRLSAAFGPWEADTGARDTLSPFHRAALLARRGEEAVLPRRSRLDWSYSREAAAAMAALLRNAAWKGGVLNLGPGAAYDLERFCAALAERYPRFRWRVGTPAAANVDLFGPQDRPPLALERLRGAGFAARFDEAAAYADYLDWLERQ
jgi:UDP-glucuronate 4-epimerase